MRTRLYYQISTAKWLFRLDGNSPLSVAEAQAHVAKEFGLALADVGVVEVEDPGWVVQESLRTAGGWQGVPPAIPMPVGADQGNLTRPVSPIPSEIQALLAKLGSETITATEIRRFLKLWILRG